MALEQRKKDVSFEKKLAAGIWVFTVLISTLFVLIGGFKNGTTQGLWFGILACFSQLMGAVFLLKSFMSQHEIELLGELKGLEAGLLEVKQLVQAQSRRSQ